ncbi:MAG: hypothetical protein K6F86_03435 [Lachnospiraceae bacterium]|nr:hypothetical protein [Lachnospiraceae bacterium]
MRSDLSDKKLEIFSSAPVAKAVLQNALPAMAAMLMILIYNLADTFFIGQTHDALMVAAVSLATPVFLIFLTPGTLFGIGGTSVISRALGEGDKLKAKRACSFCFWGFVAVGLALTVLIFIFIDPILKLAGASPDTYAYAKDYLGIVAAAGPLVIISNCYGNVVRTEGESGKAMFGLLLGNLVNVVLDPVFILALGMNVKGAAIATVIGNIAGAGMDVAMKVVIISGMVCMGLGQGIQPVADVLSLVIAAVLFAKTLKAQSDLKFPDKNEIV